MNEILSALWPGDTHDITVSWGPLAARDDASPSGGRWVPLPTPARPRLFVSTANREVAAATLATSGSDRSRLELRLRQIVGSVLSSAVGDWLPVRSIVVHAPPGETLLEHLQQYVTGACAYSIRLGRRRANQKPVLQVMDISGSVLSYVKVGTNPLTQRLVANEHEALVAATTRRHTVIVTPRPHLTHWNGLAILHQEPLHPPTTPESPAGLLAASIREIARLGAEGTDVFGTSNYRRTLEERIALLGGEAAPLAVFLKDALRRFGDQRLAIGGWHGDFRPWNMARSGDRLMLWDWERFAPRVPRGLDAIHFHHPLPAHADGGEQHAQGVLAAGARAQTILSQLDVPDEQLGLYVRLHTLEMALRSLEDAATHPSVRRNRVTAVLMETIACLGRTPN